jgi:hypothetical protein
VLTMLRRSRQMEESLCLVPPEESDNPDQPQGSAAD